MRISRRDALTGAAAAAAAAGLSMPAQAQDHTTHHVQAGDPVIALVGRLKAAYRAYIAADDTYEDAAHEAGYNIIRDFEMTTVKTASGEQYTWGRETILEAAAGDEKWAVRITPEERDRALAAIDARMQRSACARRDLGIDPLKTHAGQCRAHWRDLEAQMLDMPALTIAGVLAKVQSWYCDQEIEDMRAGNEPDQEMQTDLVASIYRDLERLAGEARS